MIRFLLACLVVILPSTAFAQAKCQSAHGKELWLDGVKAYNVQKYDDAITKWEAAYLECDDPELLFNLAQANRKAEHHERARELYKSWLRDPRTKDDPDRALVKRKIAELDVLLASQKANVESPPDGVRANEEPKAEPPAEPIVPTEEPKVAPQPAQPAVQPITQAPVRDEGTPWYSSTWGWALLGTGTAALLVGGGLILWGNQLEDDARSTQFEDEAADLFDDADERHTVGTTAMIIGGALIAGGIVKFTIDRRSSRAHGTTVSLTPSSVAFSWSF